MRTILANVGIVIVGLIPGACSIDYKAKVESTTSWSGAFGNRSVDGSGNQTVDIPDDPPECVVVQKRTERGRLKVTIVSEGGWFLNPAGDGESAATTASYGVVSVCSE